MRLFVITISAILYSEEKVERLNVLLMLMLRKDYSTRDNGANTDGHNTLRCCVTFRSGPLT